MPSTAREPDGERRDAITSPLFTIDDIARYYRVSRKSVAAMVGRGEIPLPTTKCGNRPRWHRDIIELHARGEE
jgi:hypothetical protein